MVGAGMLFKGSWRLDVFGHEVWKRCTCLRPFGGRYWLIMMTRVVELIQQSLPIMTRFNFLDAGASCMLARECLVPSWHLCRCFDVFDLCSDAAICPGKMYSKLSSMLH